MRRILLIALILCGLTAWYGCPVSDAAAALVLGWITYPARILPEVKIAWDGVATCVVCLVLFSFGLHRTLRWFHGEILVATGASLRPWSPRWTASLLICIVLMFAVGLAATGIVHQAGWLIASRRSLVEPKPTHARFGAPSKEQLGRMGLILPVLMDHDNPLERDPFIKNVKANQSWQTEILPYLDIYLGGQFHADLPWNDHRNSAYFKGMVWTYLNPEVGVVRSPEGYALSHYAGNVHVLSRERSLSRITPEETANTILAGDVTEGFKPWGNPTNLRDPGLGLNAVHDGFAGPSGSGANLLFLDGSVRFFRHTTSPDVLRRLSRPGTRPH